jgi:hypothetical protein
MDTGTFITRDIKTYRLFICDQYEADVKWVYSIAEQHVVAFAEAIEAEVELDGYSSKGVVEAETATLAKKFMAVFRDYVLRVKPYIYGTQKDMHHPECRIQIRADLFIADGRYVEVVPSHVGAGRPGVDVYKACIVDLENKTFFKDGERIKVQNTDEIIEIIKEAIRAKV